MISISTTFNSLKQYPQWVLCKYVPLKSGKTDKIPIDRSLKPINAHDRTHWERFEDVINAADGTDNLGIGFVFTKEDPFFFIDIDNCATEGATWNDIAMELCNALPGAAIEVSHSRRGLHIIGKCGDLPDRSTKCGSDFDLYTDGRFVALTGLNAVGSDSTDHTAALTAICHKYLPPRGASATDAQWTTEPVPEWSDPGDIVERALASKSAGAIFGGGVSFKDLWTADEDALGKRWPDDHGTQGRAYDASGADMALASHLAFWTGKNCERIQELMWGSGLRRDDRWGHGGYLERTILRAVSLQTEVYTGGKKAAPKPDADTENVNASGNGGEAPPYTPTDDGNRDYLVYMYGKQLHYSHQRKSWLIWGGDQWLWDQQGQIIEFGIAVARELNQRAFDMPEDKRTAALKFALKSRGTSSVNNMITFAQSAPGIPVMVDKLDAAPELVNCTNGTLNLDTKELKPHDPADLITKILSCEYKPDARSDIWDSFLSDVSKGDSDLVGYVQRVFGQALFGAVNEKHIFFIYGPSDSGKSTFINAVSAVFDDYWCNTSFETWLTHSVIGGNRGDIVDLMGTRLVTSVEVRRGAKFDEALLKGVTGKDPIKAAAKYEREVSFTPTFTLVLAGNDAPIVRDDDDGMWNRMRRIPFENSIPKDKQDQKLDEKLRTPEAQEAILRWLVDGYHNWRDHGLGTCKSVENSNNEYRTEMDRVKGFLEEDVIFSPNKSIVTIKLRSAYEMWANENGVKMLSVREFNKRLRDKGCVVSKSGAIRSWNGVTLAIENNNDY